MFPAHAVPHAACHIQRGAAAPLFVPLYVVWSLPSPCEQPLARGTTEPMPLSTFNLSCLVLARPCCPAPQPPAGCRVARPARGISPRPVPLSCRGKLTVRTRRALGIHMCVAGPGSHGRPRSGVRGPAAGAGEQAAKLRRAAARECVRHPLTRRDSVMFTYTFTKKGTAGPGIGGGVWERGQCSSRASLAKCSRVLITIRGSGRSAHPACRS